MANTEEGARSYVRLQPDESPMIMNRHALQSQSSCSSTPTVASPLYMRKKNFSKYKTAFQSLIPVRRTSSQNYELPLDNLGFFSFVTFSWMLTFLNKSWKLPAGQSATTAPSDSCDLNGQRLKHFLRDENITHGHVNARMLTTVWTFLKTRTIVASIIYVLSCTMYILGVVCFLTWFLQESTGHRTIYSVLALIFVLTMSVLLQCWSTSITFRSANRLQSAYMSVMYKHLLRVSVVHSVSVHRIVTSMSEDSQKIYDAVMYLPIILTTPFILAIPIPILLVQMHKTVNESLFAVVACVLIAPILYLLARLSNVWKSRMASYTNRRLISLYEMLLHIPLVKMTRREKLFYRNSEDLRGHECKYMKWVNICNGFAVSFLHTVPLIMIVFLWGERESKDQYELANLISILVLVLIPFKELLFSYWTGMISVFDGFMAIKRLKRVLLMDCVLKSTTRKPVNHLISVSVTGGTYSIKTPSQGRHTFTKSGCSSCCKSKISDENEVEMQNKNILKDINFSAPKEKLIGICGDISSGKTTLILAMLGQIRPIFGADKVLRDGSYAYVGQNPWIWESSLRDNILFNEMFIHKKYYSVIHCCSLNDDIGQLAGGDQTFITDNMLTLSQKQRIALARALYSNRDIYLLDDFLSAVNGEVGNIIFDRMKKDFLKGKTVIISTQQAKYLQHCDEIYVLKNGEIVDHGNHESLLSTELYALLIKSCLQEDGKKAVIRNESAGQVGTFTTLLGNGEGSAASNVVRIPDAYEEEEEGGQESVDFENRNLPSTSFFWSLLKETGTVLFLITSAILRIVCIIVIILSPILILKYGREDHSERHMYWLVAMCFFLLILMTRVIGSLLYDKVTIKISLQMHQTWIDSLCKGSLDFFHTTASTKILRWFSIHLSETDVYLPSQLVVLVENIFLGLLLLLVLAYCSVWFLIPLTIIIISCTTLLQFTRNALEKFYHLAEEACLQLLSFIASSAMGRVTIQAFGKEQEYWNVFYYTCNKYLAFTQLYNATFLWLSFWMQIISLTFVMTILGLACLREDMQSWVYIVHSPPDFAKLTVIAIFCVFLFGYVLNNIMQASTSIGSRITKLRDHDSAVRSIKPEEDIAVPFTMPNPIPAGDITFNNAKLEFWSDSNISWRGMSFQVQSGEKIGIVGLPGSGKTQIVGALFRLARLSHGSVIVGGMDISKVTVECLRSCIALIPQNPVLFSGSLQMNLDPMHKYSQRQLSDGLEKVDMLQMVTSLPDQLQTRTELLEGKLTVQERQLLYTAQALLADPKVLVIEEPIESANEEELFKVQDIINRLFHCTIMVVANRLKYASRCDKIIVVKNGQIVEFDTPENLFRDPNSYYSQMLSQSTDNLFETEV